jgi:hypothetical protein
MEFYSADIEMLMSGWNTLYYDADGLLLTTEMEKWRVKTRIDAEKTKTSI